MVRRVLSNPPAGRRGGEKPSLRNTRASGGPWYSSLFSRLLRVDADQIGVEKLVHVGEIRCECLQIGVLATGDDDEPA